MLIVYESQKKISLKGKTIFLTKQLKVRIFYFLMIIFSILFLLLSNAVTLRRDKSILI